MLMAVDECWGYPAIMLRLRFGIDPGFVFVCVTCLLIGCGGRDTPEQALREAMAGVQAAIEARDAATLDDWLAEDFIGPGGMDRDRARRTALALFMRYRDVGVAIGPLDIQLQGKHAQPGHARVRFEAVATGGSGRLLPESGQVYAVETGWRLEDGDWRMTSARWESRL